MMAITTSSSINVKPRAACRCVLLSDFLVISLFGTFEIFQVHLSREFFLRLSPDRVKVVANGAGELVSVVIDKALLEEEGLDMVQDLVVAAANAALTKAREHVDAELEKVTGGLKIPGLT